MSTYPESMFVAVERKLCEGSGQNFLAETFLPAVCVRCFRLEPYSILLVQCVSRLYKNNLYNMAIRDTIVQLSASYSQADGL